MPQEFQTLFASSNALQSGLFGVFLIALIVGMVVLDRVHHLTRFRKSVIAFLVILATQGCTALCQGFLAIYFGGDGHLTRENELVDFLALSTGCASVMAAVSWAALVYGFWHLYGAFSPAMEARKRDRNDRDRMQSLKEELEKAKAKLQS